MDRGYCCRSRIGSSSDRRLSRWVLYGRARRGRDRSPGDKAAFRRKQAAEITVPISVSGNAYARIHHVDLTKLLETPEKERLVCAVIDLRNSHRAANCEASVALPDLVFKSGVGLPRVQELISPIVIYGAVVLVGAALGD